MEPLIDIQHFTRHVRVNETFIQILPSTMYAYIPGATNVSSGSETSLKGSTTQHSLLKQLHSEMEHAWRRDPQLLTKLFPVNRTSSYREACRALYDDRVDKKRWKRIPATPKSVSDLYTPLTNLLNSILSCHQISRKERLFLNTNKRRRNSDKIAPGILLSGIGPEFANTNVQAPRAFFANCISPFEVTLGSDDLTEARDVLAVHIHRTFKKQENRRFAFGLVITEINFTVFIFDHSGAVASDPCNYHENPDQFCAVILGLAAGKAISTGFDPTVAFYKEFCYLSTFESQGDLSRETKYILDERLFQFYSLIGRGTMCWLGWPEHEPDRHVVIKDAWIAEIELEGRESEGWLLRLAQTRGVTLGVAQLHHAEDVRRSGDLLDLDTVLRNRCVEPTSLTERLVDRVHTRIVMKTHGKTLDRFSTRWELLFAFHDAVLAHRRLFEIAGILHRDISMRNILINVDGVESDRGILIDFDHAIRVDDTSPYSTKTRIGTLRYMSINVMEVRGPHTYIDDLESFYYVLCWILVVFREPGVEIDKLPDCVSFWDHPASGPLMKGSQNRGHFNLPVQPWFGPCFRKLASGLFQFFKERRYNPMLPPRTLDPTKDYDEFLDCIQQCITDMEAEDRAPEDFTVEKPPPNPVTTSSPKKVNLSNGREGSSDNWSSDYSTPQTVRKRRRRSRSLEFVKVYPKRTTANYEFKYGAGL